MAEATGLVRSKETALRLGPFPQHPDPRMTQARGPSSGFLASGDSCRPRVVSTDPGSWSSTVTSL